MRSLPQLDPRAQAWVVGLLLLAPLLVTVLSLDALGLQDLPQHVLVAQLAATPAADLPAGVSARAVPVYAPYRGLYALLGALGPTHAASLARVLLALYLALGAWAIGWVATRLPNAEPRLAVAGVATVSSAFFWSGFLTYLLALPCLLLLTGCLLELLARRREGQLRAPLVGSGLALLGLYMLHPLVLALGAVGCALTAALSLGLLRNPATRARALALWAPLACGLPLTAVALGWVLNASPQAGPGLWQEVLAQGAGIGRRLEVLLRTHSVHFGPGRRGWADIGAGLLGAGLLWPHAHALWTRARDPDRRVPAGAWVLMGLVVTSAGATLLFPWVLGGLAYAGPRFALPAWAFAVALGAGCAPAGRARRWGVGLVWAGSAMLVAVTAQALVAVGAEQRPLVELGRAWAQDGVRPRVLALDAVERSSVVEQVWQLEGAAPGQALVASRGVPAHLFGNPFLPVAVEPLPGPPAEAPWDYDPQAGHGVGASHVLLRAPARQPELFARARSRLARDFEPAGRAGAWEVWRRRQRSGR